MNTKICARCKIEKSLEAFNRHAGTSDGHQSYCVSCYREYRREYWAKNTQRLAKWNRDWRLKNPGKAGAASWKWQKKNPEKNKAHIQVRWAVKLGVLIRKACEVCGEVKVDAHHEDYSKPLEVKWLCRKHHKAVDNIVA